MMWLSTLLLGLILVLAGQQAAGAGEIRREGTTLVFSGPILPGDEVQFQRKAAEGAVARVILNSPGGVIATAWAMARQIRSLRATTVVDGSRSVCLSACTVVFVGGGARHYFNADGRADGIKASSPYGLGYHEASLVNANGQRQASATGNDMLAAAYEEFGVPKAAQLVRKSISSQIYMISGVTALSLGIATSLNPP
jgi:hypothetical protein